MASPQDDRSLGELFAELSHEVTTLVRQEVELAKAEIGKTAKAAGAHAATIAVGGTLAHAGLLVLLAALVLGIWQLGLEAWAAALIVGALSVSIGYLLVRRGRTKLQRIQPAPTQTLESLKETTTWTNRTPA